MIVSTRERRLWYLLRSAKQARLLHLTPAKMLEKIIELFELFFNNPTTVSRDKYTFHGNNFCNLVFESWKTIFGMVVRHDKMKKLTAVSFFVNEGGIRLPKKIGEKTEKCISRTRFFFFKRPVASFFILSWRTTMPNSVFQLSKNQSAKARSCSSLACRWNQLVAEISVVIHPLTQTYHLTSPIR